jgi:hypothetical protein
MYLQLASLPDEKTNIIYALSIIHYPHAYLSIHVLEFSSCAGKRFSEIVWWQKDKEMRGGCFEMARLPGRDWLLHGMLWNTHACAIFVFFYLFAGESL